MNQQAFFLFALFSILLTGCVKHPPAPPPPPAVVTLPPQGEPPHTAFDVQAGWQNIETNAYGYSLPRDWTKDDDDPTTPGIISYSSEDKSITFMIGQETWDKELKSYLSNMVLPAFKEGGLEMDEGQFVRIDGTVSAEILFRKEEMAVALLVIVRDGQAYKIAVTGTVQEANYMIASFEEIASTFHFKKKSPRPGAILPGSHGAKLAH